MPLTTPPTGPSVARRGGVALGAACASLLALATGCSSNGPAADSAAPAAAVRATTPDEVPDLAAAGLVLPAPLATDFATSGWILDPADVDEDGTTVFAGFYQDFDALTGPGADTDPDAALEAITESVPYIEIRYRSDDTLADTLAEHADDADGLPVTAAGVPALFTTAAGGSQHTLLLDTPDDFYLHVELYDVESTKRAATFLGSLQPYTAKEWGSYLAYLDDLNSGAPAPAGTD